jgi:hypothetical protein
LRGCVGINDIRFVTFDRCKLQFQDNISDVIKVSSRAYVKNNLQFSVEIRINNSLNVIDPTLIKHYNKIDTIGYKKHSFK